VPCWSDLWQHFKNLLPLLGVIASLVLYIALTAFLLWAPRLRTRWKRITSRILGLVCIAPLVVALPAIIFGLALRNSGPSAQTRTVRSADGQEASLSYKAGFLGRDYTETTLKRTGCCRHTVIFWHQGPSWFDDPKIDWLDNQHLRISYHARQDDPQHCEHQLEDITIACMSMPIPSGPPAVEDASPTSGVKGP
jgi:hypothetical protein